MSAVAIFKLKCCGRLMVFGRFKGYEESQWEMNCPAGCGRKTKLIFRKYTDEESVGVKLKGKWDDLQFLLPNGREQ